MELLNRTLFTLNDRAVTPWTLLWGLLAFALVMGLALIAAGLGRRRLFGRGHGNPPTEASLIRIWLVLSACVGFVLALRVLGFHPGSALIFLGLFLLAVALAARQALANFVAGLVLLYERSLSVGDHVQIGNESGEIEAIRLGSTYVRTKGAARLVVPNARLLRTPVTNYSAPDGRIRLCLRVTLTHDCDSGDAIMALRKVAERNPRVRKNPAPRALLTGIESAGLNFELWAWVNDPADAPYVENELYRGIQSELERARLRLAGAEATHGRPSRGPTRRETGYGDAEPAPAPTEAPKPAARNAEPSGEGDGASRRVRTRSRRSRRDDDAPPFSRPRTGQNREPDKEIRPADPTPARRETPAVKEPEFVFEAEPEFEPEPQAAAAATEEMAVEHTPEAESPVAEPDPAPPAPEPAEDDLPQEEASRPATFGRSKRKIPRR